MRGVTFGTPYFETELGRVEPDSEIHFALALYAASCDPEVGVPRDELAALLWPDSQVESARHNLRQAMYRLRQLGVPVHLKVGQVILSDVDTEVDLRELVHGGVHREDLLRIATQEFLPGYAPRIGPRYSAWVDELRDRVDRVRRHALVEAVRDARSQARFREVHKVARVLLALDPLNETATLALAEALVMDGSKVEALRMLDEYEQEVGRVSEALRVPVRTLRRRVSECLDDALLPRRFEVPFVGRDAEFRVLRESFVASRNGLGKCCVITGEAGIGKTRIAQELLRLAVLDGAMTIAYSCTSGDSVSPLSSLVALTQGLLGLPGALGCPSEHLHFLRRLESDESPLSASRGMSSDVAYAQLVYSLSELAAAITDEGPLLIFVDDAHRLHRTSWRIFSDIIDRLPERRVMLVLAARQLPEWYADLGINGSDGRCRHLSLTPFSENASRSFLDLWASKNDTIAQPSDIDRVTARAAGNPFYLGELLAHLAKGGLPSEAPASIRGLVQLQFVSLTKPAQRALLVASLLQAHASISRVASVLRLPPDQFVAVLDELEIAGMLVSHGDAMRLRHDLIGDVAMSLAPRTVLQFLRSRVALRLERDGHRAGSTELLSDALAHWERAGSNAHAYRAAMSLGSRLLQFGLSSEAAPAFQKARDFGVGAAERASASHAAINALVASYDWFAIRAIEFGMAVSDLAALTSAQRDDVDLAFEEARMWAEERSPRFSSLEALYSSNARSGVVRSRAALLALIGADNTLDGPSYISAHRLAIDAAARVAPTEEDRLLLSMLIAVASGNKEHGLLIARRLARLGSEKQPGERVRISRLAAHAILRNGRPEEALHLFSSSLDDARALKLSGHELNALEMVLRCHLQLGQFEDADRVLQELKALIPGGEASSQFASTTYFFESMLAMALEDRTRAAAARASLDRVRIVDQVILEQHVYLFSRAALSFAYPELLDDETEHKLLEVNRVLLTRGGFDLSVVALARALVTLGRASLALELVTDYAQNLRAERDSQSERVWSLAPVGVRTSFESAAALAGRAMRLL